MTVAIAFLTKDRRELSKRSLEPLIQSDKFDLHWFDGSASAAGLSFFNTHRQRAHRSFSGVTGGADAAVVYALTELLKGNYSHIGIVENDVLLHPDWFGPTFALFARGEADGLAVGAVSSRAYVDRILCQRDGYALMHNLGWGQVIFTRDAARITLESFRTYWTSENRRTFARLSGIDIGTYWAFRAGEHWTVPDWGNAAVLASRGLASLALVPSPVEMIGQKPPLAEQGLTLAAAPVEDRRNAAAFARFVETTARVRDGTLSLGVPSLWYRHDNGETTVFAHQLGGLVGSSFSPSQNGRWHLEWSPGFGGFAAGGVPGARYSCMASGSCCFLVAGGERGGQVAVEDLHSGYVVRPTLLPAMSQQVTQVMVPSGVSWREVRLAVLTGTAVFHGIRFQEPQPAVPFRFDHSKLWPVQEEQS